MHETTEEINWKEKREQSILTTVAERYGWKDAKLLTADSGYLVEYQDFKLRVATIGELYYTFNITDVAFIERKMR